MYVKNLLKVSFFAIISFSALSAIARKKIIDSKVTNTSNSRGFSVATITTNPASTRAAAEKKHLYNQQRALGDIIVKGVVVDEKNFPLLGVSVTLKGTSIKSSTDVNGLFRIQAPPDSILVFSYVGYITKEVHATATMTVTLQPAQKTLNEVVVVGYGTQLKTHVTGAIASVGTAELQQSPVANLSNALAGRLPGLVTQQTSGEPGADGATLNIRGYGTTNSTAPLVIVDGVQRDFTGLDANEIASISILKDAASTAIYGIQGANGVILVTTRRGKTGVPEISVSAQNGWQSPTAIPQYVDSYTGLELYKEGLINDGLFGDTSAYSNTILNKYKDRSYPAYQYLYPNVNWTTTMIKPFSDMSQGNLNVTGGNASAKYFVSLSYLQQNGLYNDENSISQYDVQAVTNKYNFRTNFDISITKRLTMELNLGAIIFDQNYPGTSSAQIFSAIQRTPAWYFPVTNPDGSVGAAPNQQPSPYADIVSSGFDRNFSTELQSTAGFRWDMGALLKGLSARVRLSFDNNNYRDVAQPLSYNSYQYSLKPGVADTVRDLVTNGVYNLVNQGNGTLGYNVTANGSRRTVLETYLNYDRDFGKNTINSMLIYNQSSYFDAVSTGNYEGGLPYKNQGVLGRTAYAYDEKYLAEIDFGYNGSENFAPGHRFGFFPAVSAGWIVSDENFIKNNKDLDFIDQLKIRGSYGLVGNDQGQTRFLYLSTWTTTGYGYTFGQNADGASYSGAQEGQAGNVELTWEKARKLNIGMDLGLWKNELTLTADVFDEHRTDILTTASQLTPQFAGLVSYPSVNAGIVNNDGYELSVSHKHNFNSKNGYSISVNFDHQHNKIIYDAVPDYPGREWQNPTGTSIGELYGYTSLGLFKSQADINNSPSQTGFGPVLPGDIKYKDLNGDGVINSTDAGYLPGKVPYPTSQFGVTLGYHYAAFDVSVLFQGGLGGYDILQGSGIFPFSAFGSALVQVADNHWVASNPDGNYMFPRISSQPNNNDEQSSTFWMYSSNYIRLKNAEIGYTLPSAWMNRAGIKRCRVFVSGINLLTWDKLKDFNIDPEISTGGTGGYPVQKVINVGLSFTLL